MGKRLPYTPKSQIRSALRNLFLRSRERLAALKRDEYTCQSCGAKQSRAKGQKVDVQVHHLDGVCNWDALFEAVYRELLCDPGKMQTVCKGCHSKKDETIKTTEVKR
jgi:5-methylcytosine-specific restriction endonuclease McrA